MAKILIVEDERAISNLLRVVLTDEGYQCVCAFDGEEAADIIERQPDFDLVLLDVMLPRVDGFELYHFISSNEIPVIFLTAKTDVSDKVKGIKLGAEDYITKPFDNAELLARIERVLCRYQKNISYMTFQDLQIDIDARTVNRNNQTIALTAKEFDLLVLFLRNRNKALYRSSIYTQVWGDYYLGDSRTVDLHVQRMRKKLGLEDVIVPVYKIGYKMEDLS